MVRLLRLDRRVGCKPGTGRYGRAWLKQQQASPAALLHERAAFPPASAAKGRLLLQLGKVVKRKSGANRPVGCSCVIHEGPAGVKGVVGLGASGGWVPARGLQAGVGGGSSHPFGRVGRIRVSCGARGLNQDGRPSCRDGGGQT